MEWRVVGLADGVGEHWTKALSFSKVTYRTVITCFALVEHYLRVGRSARANPTLSGIRCAPFISNIIARCLRTWGRYTPRWRGALVVDAHHPMTSVIASYAQFAHLRLVDRAHEEEVLHVGDGGDGGTVDEGVAQDDRVTDLDRHIQHSAGDSSAHDGVGEAVGRLRRHAVASDAQVIFGSLQLFAVSNVLQTALVVGSPATQPARRNAESRRKDLALFSKCTLPVATRFRRPSCAMSGMTLILR